MGATSKLHCFNTQISPQCYADQPALEGGEVGTEDSREHSVTSAQ